MVETIVGMMWNKNEGDILRDTISSALEHVDTLVIADDGSTDNSWDTIQGFANAHRDQIEHIRRVPDRRDPGQRQALLDVIRDRYRPEDTWVQIIESDIMILDTDVRKAIVDRSENDVYLNWTLLNGVIDPKRDWDEFDHYPNWPLPIQYIMTHGHRIEEMTYTFRPFKELQYEIGGAKPWPKGFAKLDLSKKRTGNDYTPILAHYGYRGPTQMYRKYNGRVPSKYPSWDMSSSQRVKETVYFFNGVWNSGAHLMSRKGWKERKHDRT